MTPFFARNALAVLLACGAGAALAQAQTDDAAAASTPRRHVSRAALPAANFLVEWRIQPINLAAANGAVVITSGSAAYGGASGYGAGAVVVGTAPAGAAQSVRVANGREGSIRFDTAETHTVYDMSYAASSKSESSTDASATAGAASSITGGSRSRSQSQDRGASGHDVVVHRVDGLRVTPRWTGGDSLELDVQMTHTGPGLVSGNSTGDARAARGFDFQSTVRLSIAEWQSVASVGDGGEELQIRVSWR